MGSNPTVAAMISIDTETTGVDFYHGARPFFVTICREDGEQSWWEWNVDPMTRRVEIPEEDLRDVARTVRDADLLVLQNAKFDVKALSIAGADFGMEEGWPWEKTRDTLLAGHLLASNQPHDLTSMAIQYLGVDIQPYEDALHTACEETRRLARSRFPNWRIARTDDPSMPSAKGSVWKYDTWLPRCLAEKMQLKDGHPWWRLLREYANMDSATTLALWKAQEQEIRRRGLWEIYLARLQVLPVAQAMESHGVTVSKTRLEELRKKYSIDSGKAAKECVDIAGSLDSELVLPKSGNNSSLSTFVFGPLGLQPLKRSEKTGAPSLDKGVLEHYEATLDPDTKQFKFVKALAGKRKRDTALAYMQSYERFWLRNGSGGWFILHPSLNPTGTDTLRWSSTSPNEQNISKKEDFNLRYVFGPAPGREWWSLDAKNIELRIPAYKSGEQELIAVFDRPDDPPYFGSYHLVVFDTLHPAMFAEHGKKCKDLYESTWYQWTKNGDFAVIYGAQEATADRTYHVAGAFKQIRHRFPKIAALSDRMIQVAEKQGYVENLFGRKRRIPEATHSSVLGATGVEYFLQSHSTTRSVALLCGGWAVPW